MHQNTGDCHQCDFLFDVYKGFHPGLRAWFKDLQRLHADAHISVAGRGKAAQELAFQHGTSRAHWGQSAHNVGCALDVFKNDPGNLYDRQWFDAVIGANIPQPLEWFGEKNSPFFELPHVQVRGWKLLLLNGVVKLVE